ncbi:MAG: alpha/beta fold hydrolase [Desulfobacterales bacterium]
MRKSTVVVGSVAGLIVLAYALGCAYLWSQQTRFIFMPARDITSTPADTGLPYEDVFIPVADDSGGVERLHAWWIPAGTAGRSTLLYLHGSALNIGANVEHAKRFHGLGFAVLLLSYRGYGRSDGDFPSETKVYQDAEAAWQYLVTKREIAPDDIVIYGHSLGGAVAIDLAVRHPAARGLIVEATFTSIYDMAARGGAYRVFPLGLILTQRFDSLSKVDRLRVPVLYLHGTDDSVAPFDMSRRLYEHTRAPKRLQLILGGGHNNSARVGGSVYLQAVKEFLDMVASDGNTPRLREKHS